jgi:amidase
MDTLKIAWASSFPGLPVQAATRTAIERLARDLADAGAHVEETLPTLDFEEQLQVRAALRGIVRMLIDEPPGGPPTALDYFSALDRRDEFIRAWEQFFAKHDALICPVMTTTAFPHCERGTPVDVDGTPQPYDLLAGYCRPFNLTGHPVITMPIGQDGNGLPIGVQVVGARWSEAHLLGIAMEIHDTVAGVGYNPPPL